MTNFIRMIHICDLCERQRPGDTRDNSSPDNFVLLFDIDFSLFESPEGDEECENFDNRLEKKVIEEYKASHPNAKRVKTFEELYTEYNSLMEILINYYEKSDEYVIENVFYDMHKFVKEDPKLIKTLEELPFDKYCFTTGFEKRAKPILQKLGIEHCFKAIFCPYEKLEKGELWIAKPKYEAYSFVENHLCLDNNTKIVFFDDVIENINAAKEFGWITYQVTPENNIHDRIKQFKDEYLTIKKDTNTLCQKTAVFNPVAFN